jgi:hypothetical protein
MSLSLAAIVFDLKLFALEAIMDGELNSVRSIVIQRSLHLQGQLPLYREHLFGR